MKKREICWNCSKERERCKAVSVDEDGVIEWVCPQCYRDLEYEKYLYEHRISGVSNE